MPRVVSNLFRNAAQASSSGSFPVGFATITHASLSEPLRICSDNVDYIYGGNRYSGWSFDYQLVTDEPRAPTAGIRVMNANGLIGAALLPLTTSPTINLFVLFSDDFGAINTALDPDARQQIGTPTVQYNAPELLIGNVQIDALWVTADLVGRDYTSEQYPGLTGSKTRFPGLFR